MTRPLYIIGLSAVAGDLSSVTAFFNSPTEGTAYLLIFPPFSDFSTTIKNTISLNPGFGVEKAESGMPVLMNTIYLIPDQAYIGINGGRFISAADLGSRPISGPEYLFSTLAEDKGSQTIAVLFAQAARENKKQAQAIEDAGGLVLVEHFGLAEADGQVAGSASEVIDLNGASSTQSLHNLINQYQNSYSVSDGSGLGIDQTTLTKISGLIKANHPYDFTEYKMGTLQRRIARRMAQRNITDVSDFVRSLEKDPRETELLVADFLIGVTSFFRNPEAFKVLENQVIPEIIRTKTSQDLVKIWASCCATGEEAYSIAILVKEYLLQHKLTVDVKIFATDINEASVRQASRGIFSDAIEKAVSPARLSNFFDKQFDGYCIKPEIREMMIFARHDLISNPPYCKVDLISCRNMLIYVKPGLQKKILAKLRFGMSTAGFLFLGTSENTSLLNDSLKVISAKWKVYQGTGPWRFTDIAEIITGPVAGRRPGPEFNFPTDVPVNGQDAGLDVHELIRQETGFTGVLVDEMGKVSQAFGDLSPYLSEERFNYQLQDLLPENLAVAFGTMLRSVRTEALRQRVNNIPYQHPSTREMMTADLVLSPYRNLKSSEKGVLVLFKPSVLMDQTHSATNFRIDAQAKAYITQLESELKTNHQKLAIARETLQTTQQAMDTFNEELVSANEELQSANEELQSINEESETVNAAHKLTIDELTELNDDLNNYFRSNLNGQLFVDREVLLKKYSPGIVAHINIRKSDLGRPLANITTNIKQETIVADIRLVLDDGQSITREVENVAGEVYQVMTSPYFRKNSLETFGAIVTFYDITALKTAQRELQQRTKMLKVATEASEMGTWSIDILSRELVCSQRINEIFGYPATQLLSLGLLVSQLEKDHQARFLSSIESAIVKDAKFEAEFPIQRHSDLASRWVRVIGSLSRDQTSPGEYLTGILHDITDHKLDDLRKNDFIAIVSHELKSPLTSIQGYLQLLEGRAEKEQNTFARGMLDKTLKQVKKMNVMINGFLNVSRLEGGKIYLNRQTFELDLLTHEVIAELSGSHPAYLINIDSHCNLLVDADRDKIGQVISNLVTNAIKYSPKAGTISLTCKKESNGHVQLSITDQGMGIEKKDVEKVFDRYFRIEDKEQKMISGFGIGLYLCREIIQSHKGKIWVESEWGVGSTFSFILPLLSSPTNN